MCDQLVSFTEFRAVLTPFSEVIRKAVTEIIIGSPSSRHYSLLAEVSHEEAKWEDGETSAAVGMGLVL